MGIRAVQLIEEKYDDLVGCSNSPLISLDEKMKAIHDCVYEGDGHFILEENLDKKRLSEEEFVDFLLAAAKAADEDFEVSKRIKALLNSYIVILSKKNENSNSTAKSDTAVSNYSSSWENNNGKLPRTQPSSVLQRSSSFLDDRSKQNFDKSFEIKKKINDLDSALKDHRQKIIQCLQDYIAKREKNPLRNMFHNKSLTEKKVKDAKALIEVLMYKDIKSFFDELGLSELNNNVWEKGEHIYSFWKSNGGEYGKCLRECREIFNSQPLELMELKSEKIKKINSLDLSVNVKNTAIDCVLNSTSKTDIFKKLQNQSLEVYNRIKQSINRGYESQYRKQKRPGSLNIME